MAFSLPTDNKFQINIVLSLDGVWYGTNQVDSDTGDIMGTGSGVPTSNVGILSNAKINPINVDIRTVRTTIQTGTFQLLDKDGIISTAIGNSDSSLLDIEAILYVGFIDGSYDFGDYLEISRTTIKRIVKQPNQYTFSGEEVTGLMNKEVFNLSTRLDGSITDSVTMISLVDATDFPTAGRARIEEEYISWTGKSGNDLTSVVRGVLSSTAAAHDDGDEVFNTVDTGDVNPIDFILDFMKSPDNGTLTDGLNILPARINETSFTDIRDDFFASDEYQFDLVEVGNGLKFLETELLAATNTRFFAKNGQINLAVLDQLDLSVSVPTMDENSIIGNPNWEIGSDKLTNKVTVNWNYSPGLDKYTRTTVSEDTDSQTTFGVKNPLVFNFKGVKAALNGSSIATDRADRLLARLSTPLASIKARTLFDQLEQDIGDKVDFSHRYIPQQGAGLGATNLQLEILSKAVDFTSGTVRFNLNFTSYSGLRVGVIAPSPLISSVIDQKTITVPDGSCYAPGYVIVLHNQSTDTTFADPPNTIASVVGNTITFVNDWTTSLLTSYSIKFAQYDLQSSLQISRYGNISPNSGFFADGTKAYQIIL